MAVAALPSGSMARQSPDQAGSDMPATALRSIGFAILSHSNIYNNIWRKSPISVSVAMRSCSGIGISS